MPHLCPRGIGVWRVVCGSGRVEGPKRLDRVLGETLREGGILVLVFGLLDKYSRGERPSPAYLTAVFAIGLSCIVVGLMPETRKDPDGV